MRVRSPVTGREVEFVGIHLYRTPEERLAQAARLDALYRGTNVPVILAGDFNSTPTSSVIALLKSSWSFVEKGADHLTFPSVNPDREIDFVAFRPGNAFVVGNERVLDEPIASDHRPLFVELIWR